MNTMAEISAAPTKQRSIAGQARPPQLACTSLADDEPRRHRGPSGVGGENMWP